MRVETLHVASCDCGVQVIVDANDYGTEHLEDCLHNYGWICGDDGNTCPTCQGMGKEWMDEAFADDLWIRCPAPKKRQQRPRKAQKQKR